MVTHSWPTLRLFVVVLLVSTSLLPHVASAEPAVAPQPEVDNTATRVEMYTNGSARWTVEVRTRLETDEQVAEYREFQSKFRNDTARYLDPFSDRMRTVVDTAANGTDREMNATAFEASTRIQEIPRRWGIVTYQFTWTGFGAVENDQMRVGDVFQGGFFIAENDTLELVPPPGYQLSSVSPDPDQQEDGIVSWVGREDFADGQPRVAYEKTRQPTMTVHSHGDHRHKHPISADGEHDHNHSTSESTMPGSPLVNGLLIVGLLGVGAYLLFVRNDDAPVDESLNPPVAEQESTPVESQPIVTDEDSVRHLLEANDGRMRQAAIANELDWSSSKASRTLSSMVEEGHVEKIRLGRENLIDLNDASNAEPSE